MFQFVSIVYNTIDNISNFQCTINIILRFCQGGIIFKC